MKPSEKLVTKASEGPEILIDDSVSDEYLRDVISKLEGLIFLESPFSQLRVLKTARELRKKTVLVPNWEWFPGIRRTICRHFDLFVCPTAYTELWVRRFGYRNTCYACPAVDVSQLDFKERNGKPTTFVHNAGVIGRNDRKNTQIVTQAFAQRKTADCRLVLNAQVPAAVLLKVPHDLGIEIRIGNVIEHKDLYTGADVCLQPSRLEGIGFQILEALLSGLPVITTDYPPMNEFVVDSRLLVKCLPGFTLPKPVNFSVLQSHLKNVSAEQLSRSIDAISNIDLSEFSETIHSVRDRLSPQNVCGSWEQAISTHL